MPKIATKSKIAGIPKWNNFLLPIGIFILAFLVRFIYLLQTKASLPFFYAPIMDELYNDNLARQIASGAGWGTEPFYRAPLYIYVLGLTYKIFGHSLFFARLLQSLLGSASCVLIFFIARKLFNRTVVILSGVIASFYAMLIYYDAQLLTTSLEIFLDLALLGLLILTAEKPKLINWFFCGIALGLSAITRPNILIFVPFILIWMFFLFRNELGVKKSPGTLGHTLSGHPVDDCAGNFAELSGGQGLRPHRLEWGV